MTSTSHPRTALVTGASSGIGATYADRLARRGYDLVLVARDGERLRQLSERLVRDNGIAAEVLQADLTRATDLDAIEARLRRDDAITLLVNNAGIGPKGPLLRDTSADLDRMVALNVLAANRLAVAAAQAFAARGTGAIINIASAVAIVPEIFNGVYSGSKAFVLALTQSLAGELKDKGVRIQAVLPGLTRTEIFDRAGGSVDSLNQDAVMDVGDMVDAALVGFDRGELLTMPSLADVALFDAYNAARGALGSQLSRRKPAPRFALESA